jgi:hypothetical protein
LADEIWGFERQRNRVLWKLKTNVHYKQGLKTNKKILYKDWKQIKKYHKDKNKKWCTLKSKDQNHVVYNTCSFFISLLLNKKHCPLLKIIYQIPSFAFSYIIPPLHVAEWWKKRVFHFYLSVVILSGRIESFFFRFVFIKRV